MPQYVRYSDSLETIEPDEAETFAKIIDVMTTGTHNVQKNTGVAVRISHAKAHGFVKGQLIVDGNLPPELAQGLFAQAGAHDVIVRLATVPGEMLDDRKVSTPRGMSLKIFDAKGPMIAGHEGNTTQDFVLDTGKSFIVGGVKAFLQAFKPNALIAPKLPDTVKGIASTASAAANAVLHAVGLESSKLDFYGHPPYHPLAEAYYSQTPLRYGDYVAKLGITPANPQLEAMFEKKIDITDMNGLRLAVTDYFATQGAEYDVSIQLATDLEQMPIEDASVQWPEELSPYRKVAKLILPPQNAWDEARQKFVDYKLSFSPAHALAAHRPLGSINRARLAVYPALSKLRHQENQQPMVEPKSVAEIPG